MGNKRELLLKVSGLETHFPVKKGVFKRTVGHVRAVDGVDLEVYRGETLGIVGESGCGKTTLGKSILQLHRPTAGSVEYTFAEGPKDLMQLSNKNLDEARRKLQIVFQNPYSSLNPALHHLRILCRSPEQVWHTQEG